jgi:hypothetical protein
MDILAGHAPGLTVSEISCDQGRMSEPFRIIVVLPAPVAAEGS